MKKIITRLLPVLLAALLATCDNTVSTGLPHESPEPDPFRDLPVVAEIEGAVTGISYQEEAIDAEIVITLTDDKKFIDKAQPTGTDVSSWFSVDFASLGLAARTKKVIAKNGTKATIGISGIPIKTLEKTALAAAIPAELLADGEAGRTADNEDVFVEIAPFSLPAAGATPICTAAQLASIGADGGLPLDGSYYLANDIDLSGYGEWQPIGKYEGTDSYVEIPFTGVLDGQGHAIKGLKLPNNPPKWITTAGPGSPTTQHSALFTYIRGAVIKNLTIELASGYEMENIVGASYQQFRIAALAGLVDGGTTIAGVTVRGPLKVNFRYATYYDNQLQIGGLFAWTGVHSNDSTIVTACRVEVDFDITSKASTLVGGLACSTVMGTVSVILSEAAGTVKMVVPEASHYLKNNNFGGLLHYYGGFICRARGSLTSNTADVDITVKNILPYRDTTWSVTTNPYIRMGGFAAEMDMGTVKNCRSSGDIFYQINTLALPPAEEHVDKFIGIITGSSSLNIDSASRGTGTVVRTEFSYE